MIPLILKNPGGQSDQGQGVVQHCRLHIPTPNFSPTPTNSYYCQALDQDRVPVWSKNLGLTLKSQVSQVKKFHPKPEYLREYTRVSNI